MVRADQPRQRVELVARRLHHHEVFLGPLDLSLPPVRRLDGSHDLRTCDQPGFHCGRADLVGLVFRIRRRMHFNVIEHSTSFSACSSISPLSTDKTKFPSRVMYTNACRLTGQQHRPAGRLKVADRKREWRELALKRLLLIKPVVLYRYRRH